MREENIERRGFFLRYRRYTEEGEGPKRGMYKVGDVRKITHRYQEYILVKSEYQTLRDHIGNAKDGDTIDVTIVAITQRRKSYGWGQMAYLDVWYKVVDGEGNTFWTTGGHRKWHYVKIGTVVLKDDVDDSLWSTLESSQRKGYLSYEGDLIGYTGELINNE